MDQDSPSSSYQLAINRSYETWRSLTASGRLVGELPADAQADTPRTTQPPRLLPGPSDQASTMIVRAARRPPAMLELPLAKLAQSDTRAAPPLTRPKSGNSGDHDTAATMRLWQLCCQPGKPPVNAVVALRRNTGTAAKKLAPYLSIFRRIFNVQCTIFHFLIFQLYLLNVN